jgi:sulfur carrier protein
MRVTINGRAVGLRDDATVADAVRLTAHSEEPRGLAVARNGEVVARGAWNERLAEGDRLEVLTAVQGG